MKFVAQIRLDDHEHRIHDFHVRGLKTVQAVE